MNVLMPCAHCDRYVRSQEASCPFCHGELSAAEARPMARALVRDQPHALVRDQPRAPVRSPSRAAAFALRAALVAPAALGCGGEEGSLERDGAQEVAAAGSDGSTGTAGGGGAGAFIDLVGGENAAAGAGGALADGAAADAGAGDAGFVPVPIYGGVFPDPVTRARV